MKSKTNPLFENSLNFQDLVWELGKIIEKSTGNALNKRQLSMIDSRIRRRIVELDILGPEGYWIYFNDHYEKEFDYLLSLLTTHYSFFFREYNQFEYLLDILPQLITYIKRSGRNEISIWSNACSKGQEVYSLALFLDKHLPLIEPGFKYNILGTDVDAHSLISAENGVFSHKEISQIPLSYLGGNFSRGTGEISNFYKIKGKIRKNCEFKEVNLLNIHEGINDRKFDIIFCRNVFIYFSKEKIKTIVEEFKNYLYDPGFLFTGSSEHILNITSEYELLENSIHIPKDKINLWENKEPIIHKEKRPEEIGVFIVDDSPTVLKMLNKIFNDDSEFKVVGSAINGKEAIAILPSLNVDAVTLDLHMPEMDGVQYLEENWDENHPPTIIVSSVSRDNLKWAQKALELGARDIIEKPTLKRFKEIGDEIKIKIKTAIREKKNNLNPIKETIRDTKTDINSNYKQFPNLSRAHLVEKRKNISDNLLTMERNHSYNFKLNNSLFVFLIDDLKKSCGFVLKTVNEESFQENMRYALEYMNSQIENMTCKIIGPIKLKEKVLTNSNNSNFAQIKSITREKEFELFYFPKKGVLRVSKEEVVEQIIVNSIKVLIIDDSPTIINLIKNILGTVNEIKIVGSIHNPLEAEKMIMELSPDIIILDIHMPQMRGDELLRELGTEIARKTIIISNLEENLGDLIIDCLELDAFEFIKKPDFKNIGDFQIKLIETIEMAYESQIKEYKKVISHKKLKNIPDKNISTNNLILIGASTGGIVALQDILNQLPAGMPPILIVQHIPEYFSKLLADRLSVTSSLNVKEAEEGEEIKSNYVYLAPGNKHMGVIEKGGNLFIKISHEAPINHVRPSVDYLFNCIAKDIHRNTLGILLTGMGSDGAIGLLNLKNSGAFTMAQDKTSSVVYGMPGAAHQIGATNAIESLDDIPQKIIDWVGKK